MNCITERIDAIADSLEKRGLIKEATSLDTISDTIEKLAAVSAEEWQKFVAFLSTPGGTFQVGGPDFNILSAKLSAANNRGVKLSSPDLNSNCYIAAGTLSSIEFKEDGSVSFFNLFNQATIIKKL